MLGEDLNKIFYQAETRTILGFQLLFTVGQVIKFNTTEIL